MRRILVLAILALLGLSSSAFSQIPMAFVTPLYPLVPGATWTYEVEGGEITVKVVGLEKIGNVECYKLETLANGKLSATEHVRVEKDGVYRYAVNGKRPDTPIKFLQLPACNRATWTVDTKSEGQEMKWRLQIGREDVAVKAGYFKQAITVEVITLKIGGTEYPGKFWYVKGIGLVKSEFKLAGFDFNVELKSYEIPKSPDTVVVTPNLLEPCPVIYYCENRPMPVRGCQCRLFQRWRCR